MDLHKAPTIGVFAGKTALMWAASQGRTEVVKLLLSLGADFDYTSSIGNFKVSLLPLHSGDIYTCYSTFRSTAHTVNCNEF